MANLAAMFDSFVLPRMMTLCGGHARETTHYILKSQVYFRGRESQPIVVSKSKSKAGIVVAQVVLQFLRQAQSIIPLTGIALLVLSPHE